MCGETDFMTVDEAICVYVCACMYLSMYGCGVTKMLFTISEKFSLSVVFAFKYTQKEQGMQAAASMTTLNIDAYACIHKDIHM
jgi:hypothetical protein